MTDQKPAAEPDAAGNRSIPGGSLKAARLAIGVSAVHHYEQAPTVKAALPDLSDTPGWNMVPKDDRRS
jgi:hypothetical protein